MEISSRRKRVSRPDKGTSGDRGGGKIEFMASSPICGRVRVCKPGGAKRKRELEATTGGECHLHLIVGPRRLENIRRLKLSENDLNLSLRDA